MKSIPAATFKQKCLQILDNVSPEGIVITKRGKPVAKLMPLRGSFGEMIGSLKGSLRTHGDLLRTGIKWDAESRHAHRRKVARRKSDRA